MSDYLLKANVILALLYAFYRLFFYRDTFFNYRRISLLAIIAVSALAPLPWTQLWIHTWPTADAVSTFTAEVLLPEFVVTAEGASATSGVLTLAAWLYGAGVCLLLGRIGVQLLAIIRLNHRCPRTEVNGTTVRVLPEGEAPFSFFNRIFVCPGRHTPGELDEILTHEQTHARQAHSIDVLIGELACAFCWFNPFAWLWKREIRQNLEYLADRSVLDEGHDRRIYQYHLLGLAYHKAAATIYNNFNVLPLKKRIRMMNKKRTQSIGQLKYLLFLPVAALLAAACAGNSNKQDTTTAQPEAVEAAKPETPATTPAEITVAAQPTEEAAGTPKETTRQAPPPPKILSRTPAEGDVLDQVDQVPQFPGGPQKMFQYLGENLKYPVAAQEAGQQGKVYCGFVVNADGHLSDFEVVKGICPELDEEAIRVIKAMPAWTPGKKDGKAVNVRYTLPIAFRLQ